MNLSEMRTRVRQDLRDLDAADYRWSDAELDRHIEHGVRELSLAVPQEAKANPHQLGRQPRAVHRLS